MTGTSAILSTADFDFLLQELRRSGQELVSLLPPAASLAWMQNDGDGRWSVADNVEHLILVETMIQQSLPALLAEGPRPDWESVELTPMEMLQQIRTPGARRVEAPPRSHPAGTIPAAELCARFQAARAGTVAWTEGVREQPLRAILPPPHAALGQLNLAQRLLSMAWHTDRHAAQIRACLAASNS